MADLSSIAAGFGLDGCTECGTCSDSCPSRRNGGIDPQLTVSSVLNGGDAKDVWRCLVCHRCSMACPQGIDVAGMMLALREIDSKVGGTPVSVRRSYDAFVSDGRLGLPKGRMEALRKELGLPDVVADRKAADELKMIMKEAGVR